MTSIEFCCRTTVRGQNQFAQIFNMCLQFNEGISTFALKLHISFVISKNKTAQSVKGKLFVSMVINTKCFLTFSLLLSLLVRQIFFLWVCFFFSKPFASRRSSYLPLCCCLYPPKDKSLSLMSSLLCKLFAPD